MYDDAVGLDADAGLEGGRNLGGYLVIRFRVVRVLLDLDRVLAGEILLKYADEVLAGDAVQLADDRLDITGEDVDGGDDEHVILAAVDVDTAVGSAAGAGGVVDPADVAGAEPDQRAGVLAQGGEDQLAHLTGLEHFAGVNVHRLHEDVVLGDVQAVLGFAHGGAGAENVGQAVEIVHLGAPQVFDGLAGRVDGAAQLTGDDDFLDVQILLGVDARFQRLLAQLPCVGRAGPDDGGLVGLQHEEQALAGERAAPDAERAEVLGTDDVGAADVQREVQRVDITILRPHADLPEPAAFGVLEFVEIFFGEGAHRRYAGGA